MSIRTIPILATLLVTLVFAAAGIAQDHDDHDHSEHTQHEKAGEHDDHDHADPDHDHAHDHDDHGDHEEGVIRITPQVMREFDIDVETAGRGSVSQYITLPGEVVYNADRVAHVTPTVTGSVKQVNFSVGDQVEKGEIMAVLNSRELAAVRSDYLKAKARLGLVESTLQRDQRLFDQKVGTERAVLEAEQAYEEAKIAAQQAENALHALGYSHEQIDKVAAFDGADFNTYELLAPISGVVTQRHLTVGEVIEPDNEDAPFVVADLSTVWVNLTVYQRDLANVKAGQHAMLKFNHGIPDAESQIVFVSPALDEATRTATARINLKNPDGHWRPGLFLSAGIVTGDGTAQIVVPRSAVTELEGKTIVFVQTDEGFAPREVTLGRTSEHHVEITSGLKTGDRYAARNVLVLKAEMNRAALEHAGHAH